MTQIEIPSSSWDYPKMFTEPFSGERYDRAYGAMPANPFLDDAVKSRQANVEASLKPLFKHPPEELEIPDSFRRFFLEDYEIGERLRQLTNFNNNMAWEATNPEVPEELLPAVDRYLTGHAEVDDIVDIAMNTTASGLEIGRVTHPYWWRMQYVAPLRASIASAIEARGGFLVPKIAPYFSIDIIPHVTKGEVDAFLTMYKHDIGVIPRLDGKNVRFVERQIAGIRTDEASGFRQDILQRMQWLVPQTNNDIEQEEQEPVRFQWDNSTKNELDYQLRSTGARGFIEKAVQADSTEAYMVPESTTVYAFTEDPELSSAMAETVFRTIGRDSKTPYYN